MKKAIIVLLSSLLFNYAYSQNENETTTVLFLGNSYTYYNDGLDQVFKLVANSLGHEVETISNSPGGYTLENHCSNSTSLSYIQSREWDYVVLQEQSQMPAFLPSQVAAETYPFATILCDSIHNNSICTTPIFFMTWGRENGDTDNCPYYPPICTYDGMQWRLRQSYVEMAESNNGIVSPVGMVWKSIRDNHPEIGLYQSDESHPTDKGTYIAACTFYASIFHESPVGADYPDEVSADIATIIQNTAWDIVNDSLDIWRIDTTTLRVDFEPTYPIKSFSAYFENYTENADSCLWDFGDSSSEWQYPVWDHLYDMMEHQYLIEDEYEICLNAYKDCQLKNICKIRYIFASDITKTNKSGINIYPNPIRNGIIQIENQIGKEYCIYSIEGKLVLKSYFTSNIIDVSKLKNGVYTIVIDRKSYKVII